MPIDNPNWKCNKKANRVPLSQPRRRCNNANIVVGLNFYWPPPAFFSFFVFLFLFLPFFYSAIDPKQYEPSWKFFGSRSKSMMTFFTLPLVQAVIDRADFSHDPAELSSISLHYALAYSNGNIAAGLGCNCQSSKGAYQFLRATHVSSISCRLWMTRFAAAVESKHSKRGKQRVKRVTQISTDQWRMRWLLKKRGYHALFIIYISGRLLNNLALIKL